MRSMTSAAMMPSSGGRLPLHRRDLRASAAEPTRIFITRTRYRVATRGRIPPRPPGTGPARSAPRSACPSLRDDVHVALLRTRFRTPSRPGTPAASAAAPPGAGRCRPAAGRAGAPEGTNTLYGTVASRSSCAATASLVTTATAAGPRSAASRRALPAFCGPPPSAVRPSARALTPTVPDPGALGSETGSRPSRASRRRARWGPQAQRRRIPGAVSSGGACSGSSKMTSSPRAVRPRRRPPAAARAPRPGHRATGRRSGRSPRGAAAARAMTT